MRNKLLRITSLDSVAVAIESVKKNETYFVDGISVTLLEDIDSGHKVALKDIKKDEPVIKYGYPIGAAKVDIPKGAHVHADNLRTLLKESASYQYDERQAQAFKDQAKVLSQKYHGKVPTIEAYQRADGKIGIRNELWIVPTVGCVNRVGERLVSWAQENLKIEGVHLWSHPFGCSQLGEDHEATRSILADLVHHPNAGGVLVLSLGCENNTPESFKALVGKVDPSRVKFLTCQDVEDEIAEGEKLLSQLADTMAKDKRTRVSMSSLVVGFKCGGSDGFSGITANPLVGRFCDVLTAMGGTAVLTEVPEMFGAEQILMNRADTKDVFEKTVKLINDFKAYFVKHGQVVYENPSPGNKAGGISSLEDKSLGCVQKGGQAVVKDVLPYGGRVSVSGLNLLSGPGNDIVSTTALTAAGCHLILFTTGRGTPLGAPVPTIKVGSNDEISAKKSNWIDFNAGRMLSENPIGVTNALLKMVEDCANGTYRTKNEQNGYAEISLFKDGVIL
ncbi:MAG: altronate dehydratase family protein [Sphaerochaetaceae bacterium]